MRREFESLLELARSLPSAELPAFLGELEQVRVTALARIAAPVTPAPDDCLLTVEQVAERTGMSANYIYRHSTKFGGRREGRALRFSSARLDQYLRRAR